MRLWPRSLLTAAALVAAFFVWSPTNAGATINGPYTFSGPTHAAPGEVVTFSLDVSAEQSSLASFFVVPLADDGLTFQSVLAGNALSGLLSLGDPCGSTTGNCGGIDGSLKTGHVLTWTFMIDSPANSPTKTIFADIKTSTDFIHEDEVKIPIQVQVTNVPEPASAVFFIGGLGILGLARLRRLV